MSRWNRSAMSFTAWTTGVLLGGLCQTLAQGPALGGSFRCENTPAWSPYPCGCIEITPTQAHSVIPPAHSQPVVGDGPTPWPVLASPLPPDDEPETNDQGCLDPRDNFVVYMGLLGDFEPWTHHAVYRKLARNWYELLTSQEPVRRWFAEGALGGFEIRYTHDRLGGPSQYARCASIRPAGWTGRLPLAVVYALTPEQRSARLAELDGQLSAPVQLTIAALRPRDLRGSTPDVRECPADAWRPVRDSVVRTGALGDVIVENEAVAAYLASLLPAKNAVTDHRIRQAIACVTQTIGADLWKSPAALTGKGSRVFDRYGEALAQLAEIKDVDVSAATEALTGAAWHLAESAIDKAELACGPTKEVAEAREELSKAIAKIRKVRSYVRALDHMKAAWVLAEPAWRTLDLAHETLDAATDRARTAGTAGSLTQRLLQRACADRGIAGGGTPWRNAEAMFRKDVTFLSSNGSTGGQ